MVSYSFDKACVKLLCFFHILFRDFFCFILCAKVILIEMRLQIDKGYTSCKFVLCPNWKQNRMDLRPKAICQCACCNEKVLTHFIHFINEYHTWYNIGSCLTPNCFSLWL